MHPIIAAIHGMLIFGMGPVYFSHLPMFHAPHDYQLVWKVDLDCSLQRQFIADQKHHPDQKIYTAVPEKFVLPDMVAHPHAFKVTLYRGHFERGGEAFASGMATPTEVVHFHQLKASTSPGKEEFTFGGWSAHLIGGKPDFDRIVKLPDTEIYLETGDLED